MIGKQPYSYNSIRLFRYTISPALAWSPTKTQVAIAKGSSASTLMSLAYIAIGCALVRLALLRAHARPIQALGALRWRAPAPGALVGQRIAVFLAPAEREFFGRISQSPLQNLVCLAIGCVLIRLALLRAHARPVQAVGALGGVAGARLARTVARPLLEFLSESDLLRQFPCRMTSSLCPWNLPPEYLFA